jgi:NADH:ubiquinone oxidoreductase subunit H
LFLGIQRFYLLIGFLFSRRVVYLWVWIRVTYPRLRYDLLIIISWKRVLPFVLGFLCYLILITYII